MEQKKLVLGILAHVDAGKTTLAESLLYMSGAIRKLGRVDHQDAFLDTFAMERARGITIFSKLARMKYEQASGVQEKQTVDITLLDTPGHVDFSAEMERTLQVLDYAILVISAADGVTGHDRTLWKLLQRYEVPTFLFVNKMDQTGADQAAVLADLKAHLDENITDFGPGCEKMAVFSDGEMTIREPDAGEIDEFCETVSLCDERLMEQYLECGEISDEDIAQQIGKRRIFPCLFGSALKVWGVEEFFAAMMRYSREKPYNDAFGARVYKISRDEQGNRLTHLKVTGGTLKIKQSITDADKIDQIRLYSGTSYETVTEAGAGMICAVTGLTDTFAGQGLGAESESTEPFLEPVLTYEVILPDGCNVQAMLQHMRELEEEEPLLHIVWIEHAKEIHAQVMGPVQMEILKNQILERFGTEVTFGPGSIVYKETISSEAEGVGHFEPLRHYAEVHLLLQPGERGSGIQLETDVSEDLLDRNWQRLVLTHLAERRHRGVLTGSELTDVRITLIAGKAHLKHTEGGDFRQATYRAVRQGLMMADSVLLEPFYAFHLELPADKVGRAMTDIQKMNGEFSLPMQEENTAILEGSAPVSCMRDYAQEVQSYTSGNGHLTLTLRGYGPCHNQEEVVAACGYDPELDLRNPTGSVFCAHGAGYVVPWDQVYDYMHVPSPITGKGGQTDDVIAYPQVQRETSASDIFLGEDEVKEIFERTYGPIKSRVGSDSGERVFGSGSSRGEAGWKKSSRAASQRAKEAQKREMERNPGDPKYDKKTAARDGVDYLLVDGYNIIFAWEDLRELSRANLSAARDKLMDLLSDYQGFNGQTVILVFDAYKVKGNVGEVIKYHNIYVVYTKEAETADMYIERAVRTLENKQTVTVATSDGLEQVIILGAGAVRMPASQLREELDRSKASVKETLKEKNNPTKSYLGEIIPEELRGNI